MPIASDKDRFDSALIEFFRQELGRAKSKTMHRTRRLLWEICNHSEPEKDYDWLYLRFQRWVERLPRDEGGPRYDGGLSRRLQALGFPSRQSFDKWKSDLKHRWGQCRPDLDPDDFPTTVAVEILSTPESLRRDLKRVQDVLGISTAWEEALADRVQSSPESALLVALYPPGNEIEALAAALGVARRLSQVCVRIAGDDRREEVLPELHAWEEEKVSTWLAILLDPERYADNEEALDYLLDRPERKLLLCRSEHFLRDRRPSEVVLLGRSVDFDGVVSIEQRTLAGIPIDKMDVTTSGRILRTICLFTAWGRTPRVDRIARICDATAEQVVSLVESAEGLFRTDENTESRQVVSGDDEWATQYVLSQYSEDELAAQYADVLTAFDSRDEADRRAVRHLIAAWHWNAPPRLRLARGVLAGAKENLFAFARREAANATQARVQWARFMSWMGEHQEAHDLILDTDRKPPLESRVEDANAEIFLRRFRYSGREAFLRYAEDIYIDLAEGVGLAEHARLKQERAAIKLLDKQPDEAHQLLSDEGRQASNRALALRATALAERGDFNRAVQVADRMNPRRPLAFELDHFEESTWNDHVDSLLREPHYFACAAIHQAATRALERGHFQTARKLIDHGLTLDPDSIYLSATRARLFHELGDFSQATKIYRKTVRDLAGFEAELVIAAWMDSALELYRALRGKQPKSRMPIGILNKLRQPIEKGKPTAQSLAANYYLHLVTLEAKAHWYGYLDSPYSSDLVSLCEEILSCGFRGKVITIPG